MPFSLVKAIKSTHRNSVNRILHFMGLPIYFIGIMLMLGYFLGLNTDPILGITLWSIAICLFLIGHKKEGNLRATTLIVFLKYLSSKKSIRLILSYPRWAWILLYSRDIHTSFQLCIEISNTWLKLLYISFFSLHLRSIAWVEFFDHAHILHWSCLCNFKFLVLFMFIEHIVKK